MKGVGRLNAVELQREMLRSALMSSLTDTLCPRNLLGRKADRSHVALVVLVLGVFLVFRGVIISPTHKRTEGRAPVWGSEFTKKVAALQGDSE